ncbi:MAG: ComEC/Rec2 family competence protein [Muribaculaceae bacterium]|nr:ComEC/Rec2 family competence protein [Muribaculaceae bacterium]
MPGKTLSLILMALIGGILIGRLPEVPLWGSLFPLGVALGLFLFSRFLLRKNPFRSISLFNEGVAGLLFGAIGIFSAALGRPASTEFPKGEYNFSGKVKDYSVTTSGDRLLLALSSLSDGTRQFDVRNVNALITLTDATDVDYGNTVSGRATLAPADLPANYLNDDYVKYLHSKGIFLTGFVSAADCHVTASPKTSFRHYRYFLERQIENAPLASDTKNFLVSVLLGDKAYITADDRLTFSDAGISHIFAVSGLHVSMVGMFVLGGLSLLFHGRLRRWKFLLCLPLVWGYVLMVGASPATCRAAIMLSIGMAALFLQRKNDALKALGWSAVLILAFYPAALFDIGFQLSVVCVGALILIAQPLNFIDHRRHPRLYTAVGVCLVTLTATFSSWILCAYYFHRFSLMFLPLNLIAVPLLPFFLMLAVLYLVLFHLGLPVMFLGKIIDEIYAGFRHLCSVVSSSSTAVENFHPGGVSVWLWLAGLVLLAYMLNRPHPLRRLWQPVSLFGVSLLSLMLFPASTPSGFIIQKNSSEQSLMHYSDGLEARYVMPPGASSRLTLNGLSLLSLRSEVLSEATMNALRSADVILIGDGCRKLPRQLANLVKDGAVVATHPTLHWSYERKMLAEAESLGLRIHSIRYDGPLHFFR